MTKCEVCRQKDYILLTRWERVRYWLYFHINTTLFPQDFDDTKSEKFTQGYSDGYIKGTEHQRERYELINKRYGKS